MIMIPYRFCEDEKADLCIQRNLNLLIAKMMDYQMDTACTYAGICGYSELADPANLSAFYRQIGGFFPKWIEPKDAITQFILLYATVQSRKIYKLFLLQEYLLDRLISESKYLALEILPDGENAFKAAFPLRDRELVGNALADEFVETVANIYQSFRPKRRGDKFRIYSRIPYPEEKLESFENVFCLKSYCLADDTFTLLESLSPDQLTVIFAVEDGIIEPVMKIPERWWTRTQDICDVEGNPPGLERSTAEIYMPYMGLLDDLDE